MAEAGAPQAQQNQERSFTEGSIHTVNQDLPMTTSFLRRGDCVLVTRLEIEDSYHAIGSGLVFVRKLGDDQENLVHVADLDPYRVPPDARQNLAIGSLFRLPVTVLPNYFQAGDQVVIMDGPTSHGWFLLHKVGDHQLRQYWAPSDRLPEELDTPRFLPGDPLVLHRDPTSGVDGLERNDRVRVVSGPNDDDMYRVHLLDDSSEKIHVVKGDDMMIDEEDSSGDPDLMFR